MIKAPSALRLWPAAPDTFRIEWRRQAFEIRYPMQDAQFAARGESLLLYGPDV